MLRPLTLFSFLLLLLAVVAGSCNSGGGTGNKLVAIFPNEVVVPNNAVRLISSKDWPSSPPNITLVSKNTGHKHTLSVLAQAGKELIVSIPHPGELVGRMPYRLVIGNTGPSVPGVTDLFLSNPGPPAGERINVSLVNWTWNFKPGQGTATGLHQLAQAWHFAQPYQWDPYPDTWASWPWSSFEPLFSSASQAWGSACGEAMDGTPSWVTGVVEATPRVTLVNSFMYFMQIDSNLKYVAHMGNRLKNNLNVFPFVEDDLCAWGGPWDWIFATHQPLDCASKFAANSNNRVNVHLVGALYQYGEEVDPAISRAITSPPNTYGYGNTHSMIILTDNPLKGSRWNPNNYSTGSYPYILVAGTPYADSQSPLNNTYWTPEKNIPNVLAHELHHLLTGYAHSVPDTCYGLGVGSPTAACPRGIDMNVWSGATTRAQECDTVLNGIGNNDYTL